jgi:DNA topoisomerase-1
MFQSASKTPGRKRRSLEERTAKWWRRRGSKEHGFWYETTDGSRITAADALARIKSLVIPPAWTDVRIATSARATLQAIGRDGRGRVQYLYHPSFVRANENEKFARVPLLGALQSLIRRRTRRHLNATHLSKESVLAAIVRLITKLHFRVGSEKSVHNYKTYGITTLRSSHVLVHRNAAQKPTEVEFNFVGKHHIRHRKLLRDSELAQIIEELKALPGSRLFKYVTEDGSLRTVRSKDVNDYIKQVAAPEFTSKDFRTWAATLHAARELAKVGVASTKTEQKRRIVAAIKTVAERLGNTVSVCRSSYIHPAVLRAYEVGKTLTDFLRTKKRKPVSEEEALIRMLKAPLPQPR